MNFKEPRHHEPQSVGTGEAPIQSRFPLSRQTRPKTNRAIRKLPTTRPRYALQPHSTRCPQNFNHSILSKLFQKLLK